MRSSIDHDLAGHAQGAVRYAVIPVPAGCIEPRLKRLTLRVGLPLDEDLVPVRRDRVKGPGGVPPANGLSSSNRDCRAGERKVSDNDFGYFVVVAGPCRRNVLAAREQHQRYEQAPERLPQVGGAITAWATSCAKPLRGIDVASARSRSHRCSPTGWMTCRSTSTTTSGHWSHCA